MIESIGLNAAALESEYKLRLHGRSSIIDWFFRVMLYYHLNCNLVHDHPRAPHSPITPCFSQAITPHYEL